MAEEAKKKLMHAMEKYEKKEELILIAADEYDREMKERFQKTMKLTVKLPPTTSPAQEAPSTPRKTSSTVATTKISSPEIAKLMKNSSKLATTPTKTPRERPSATIAISDDENEDETEEELSPSPSKGRVSLRDAKKTTRIVKGGKEDRANTLARGARGSRRH